MAHDVMIRDRSIASTTAQFIRSLPDGAQESNDQDKTMISKTSPTVWEYEMFRIEWNRRSMLRGLYELVREDTRVRQSNYVFASTAVRRGFDLLVTSDVSQKEAQKAQDILNDFIRRVQLNAKLEPWARVNLRDGDLFLNPVIDQNTRLIRQIKSLPAITMQRNDDITGNFPDFNSAFQQIDPLSLQPLLELALWQVNHIRWNHEDGERYGQSQYLANLTTWRKLNMSEQDLVIRRRTRAAPKRVHLVGNKDRPASTPEIKEYMELNKMDGSNRDIVTDYFLNGMGDIKDLNADAQLDHIKDIEHLQDVHMLGTGVPLAMLGFGQNVNRDVVEDQMKQFKENVEKLRRVLEFGDGSAYSGIRALFDFQLALQGIDPSILDYNIVWNETDDETANDRVNRVTSLRSAQPDPLISRNTAIRIIGKDIGLDTDDAIDQELAQIKEEQAEALKEKQAEQAALNPPGTEPPKPLADATESEGVSMNLKNIDMRSTGNNISFPLRNDPRLLQMEKHIRTNIKGLFGTMAQNYVLKNKKRMAKLADLQPSSTTGALDSFIVEIDEYTHMLMHPDGACFCTVTDDVNQEPPHHFHASSVVAPFLMSFMNDAQEMVEALKKLFRTTYLGAGEVARSNVVADSKRRASTISAYDGHAISLAPDANVKRLLQHEADDHVNMIMQTTQKLLAKTLTDSFNNQEPADEIVKKVEEVLSLPDWRADTIAGTEIANAYTTNKVHAYSELGQQQVRWVAYLDDKTCVKCANRHNQVYTLADLPKLPAHQNCRCDIVDPADPIEWNRDSGRAYSLN